LKRDIMVLPLLYGTMTFIGEFDAFMDD
jgi:hypothetical protein